MSSVAFAQARTDIVRGRVVTDSAKAVTDAEIIVTMAPTRVVVRGTAGPTGSYELKLSNGTGEYLVYISAAGRVATRKRIVATGGDSTFIVDAKLAAIPAATLTAVRTVASNARPPRTGSLDPSGPGLTGIDRTPEGVVGQLPPDLAANLDALAGSIPGLSVTPDGVSALGMTGANLSTLNGLAMGVGDIPRGAKFNARFQTSPFDPTKGGFAGAQLSLNIPSGGEFAYRRGHLTLDAPQLQAAAASANPLGQKHFTTALGYGADGPIVPQKYFYNAAAEFTRSTTPVASLLDADAHALEESGIAADSARRLVQVLAARGIPANLSAVPGDRTTTAGSFIARLDRSAQPTSRPGGLSSAPWWLLTTGSLRQSDAVALSPATLPSATSQQRSAFAGVEGFYSTYVGPARLWLNETTASVAAHTNRGDPYLTLPAGSVLLTSSLATSTAVRPIAFGGNSANYRRDNAWSAEVANSTTFLVGGRATRPIKLFAQGRYDGFDETAGVSRLGSFSFASVSDIAANRPSSFSRALNVRGQEGGEVSGAVAAGLNWTMNRVNVVGGLRAEGNEYTNGPELNPQVQSTFGLATDRVPNTVALSPRLGFSWTYQGPNGPSFRGSPMASAWRGPTSIRGGVGRFRNLLTPTLIADALTTTGLPDATSQLVCIGNATPIPDWRAYAADVGTIPTQCVGAPSAFSDAAPSVIAFDRGYGPQDAWRATLGATRTLHQLTYISVDAVYSLNLGQPSAFDVNFAGLPQLALADEANRPVYVGVGSIDAATGLVSPVEARQSPAFGRVIARRSNLRSDARQLVVHTIPNIQWFDPFITLDYVYTDSRVRLRGFDATTAADPRVAQWAPDAYTPRHRFILQTGKTFKGYTLTAFTSVQSGMRFTPMVSGDINGDGLRNDRAFITPAFTGADSATTAAAHALQQLMVNGPRGVRSCLTAQLGLIAAPNSCSAPWAASMNARLAYNRDLPYLGRKATIAVNLSNPLAAADLVLHGDDRLRGWGTAVIPDATLLYVRGFDQNATRFRYEVNPRFGATSPQATAILNPFRATIDMRVDLGRSVDAQQVDVNLRPPRGSPAARASADTIKARFLNGSIGSHAPQDVYGAILYFKDSLALSTDQIRRLDAARRPFRAQVESLYTDLANYLAALPPVFSGDVAAQHIREVSDAAWNIMHDQGPLIREIMSPEQLRLLAAPIITTLTQPFTKSYWSGAFGARWR